MPAVTRRSTYTPGKGNTVRSKSGKAKAYEGSGAAPAGTKKVKPKTAATVPTITEQDGELTFSNYPARAKTRALNRVASQRRRVQRILAADRPKAPKRPLAPTHKPVALTPIQKTEQRDAKAFNAEGGKQVPVPFTHQATPVSTPVQTKPVAAKSSVPQLKGTPQQRKRVRARLQETKAEVRHSKGHLTGDLGPEQRKFVRGVAKNTKLRPRTIAAQARAEEGNGAQTEAEQTHNFLNMGPGIVYPDLRTAVHETSKNYNTNPAYAGVRATRGAPASTQAAAIASSPWGTGPLIEQTLSEVGFKPGDPKARQRYQKVVRTAKKLGMKVAPLGKVGPPPKQVVTRYRAGEAVMEQLDRRNNRGEQPYVWGGGHGNNPVGGADCSGSVSYALVAMHILKKGESLVSGEMGRVLKPGPGAITVFYNADHVFIYDAVRGEYWGTSTSNDQGGAGYFPKSVGDAEVASGNSAGAYNVGHVPGLGKKQALQLGAANVAFPGMSYNGSTNTATITSGTTQTTPGFSKRPIKLTKRQQINRAERKLKAINGPKSEPTSSSSELTRLEQRYGKAAV